MSSSTTEEGQNGTFDAIIVGAGFAGLYAIHKLRDQRGMHVRVFD